MSTEQNMDTMDSAQSGNDWWNDARETDWNEDAAPADVPQPEVTINAPGYQFHGYTARLVRNLIGDQRALLHVYDHVHVALPFDQIVVKPRTEVQPCL